MLPCIPQRPTLVVGCFILPLAPPIVVDTHSLGMYDVSSRRIPYILKDLLLYLSRYPVKRNSVLLIFYRDLMVEEVCLDLHVLYSQ